MKHNIKVVIFICTIATFSLLFGGCSRETEDYKSQIEKLKTENKQLKDKVSSLEKSVNDYKTKELNQDNLLIAYREITDNVRFVEKENNLLALPQDGAKILRNIQANTLAQVLDRAIVNDNETWIYISIPVYDTAANYKGWIKEKDTLPYTKDKVQLVQSDVKIMAGAEVYETFKFEDIKKTTPVKLPNEDSGRLQEKIEGYCRISQAGGRDIWVKESSIVYPKVTPLYKKLSN